MTCSWRVVSIAGLCFCSGAYLRPPWLSWIVFGWSLILLDLLAIASGLTGQSRDFAYALISAEAGLLILWAIMGPVGWQWRLPSAGAAAAAVIIFSQCFGDDRTARSWNLLMIANTVAVVLACGGLRMAKFSLQLTDESRTVDRKRNILRADQFGIKHMLFWATALVPLLLVLPSTDFHALTGINSQTAFPVAVVGVSITAVNLLAIWAPLGRGVLPVRLLVVLFVPFAIGAALSFYSESLRPPGFVWPNVPILDTILGMKDRWGFWLFFNATLVAALLLFVRAQGYRLIRSRSA